ncbi:uncharacterized protein LOC135847798 [Planococcus citri]|uniref:uncharacterized protein LOC135847798 n=1 Tax=Planococcus citri TaxID=170843 RepID=UPI0031F9A13F
MLLAIFFVFFITLAKLHSGDGIERYRSFSGGRFPNLSSVSAPPPSAPSPVPQSRLTPSPSGRFSAYAPQQPAPPVRGRPSPYDDPSFAPQSSGRFGNSNVSAQSRKPNYSSSGMSPTENSNLMNGGNGGRRSVMIRVDQNGNPLDEIPEGFEFRRGGPVMTESEYQKQQKRREEEADPDSRKINTGGETILKRLPENYGEISIKISGTNITQRKMNQLRKLLEESTDFVFGHPEFITGIMNRFV